MATLRLEGVEQIEARLVRTEREWKNISVAFSRAAVVVYASTKGKFSASGPGWKAVTRGGQPLRDTGRLMASVTSKAGVYRESHGASRHTLDIGTNVVYANVHQFGFRGTQTVPGHTRTQTQAFGRAITPRSVTVKAHTRNMTIEARPFLEFDDRMRADIVNVFEEWYTFKS